jgi:hypothetical protein
MVPAPVSLIAVREEEESDKWVSPKIYKKTLIDRSV